MASFTLNDDILQTATGSISGDIQQIQEALYGREVRASIAEALYLLYTSTAVSPDAFAELTEQVANCNAQVASNNGKWTTLSSTVTNLREQVEALQETATDTESDVTELQEQVKTLQEQAETLQENYVALCALVCEYDFPEGVQEFTAAVMAGTCENTENSLTTFFSACGYTIPDVGVDAVLAFVGYVIGGTLANNLVGWNIYMKMLENQNSDS